MRRWHASGLLVLAVVVAAFVVVRRDAPADEPTPLEHAHRLSTVSAMDLGPPDPLRFSRWIGPTSGDSSATITAVYDRGGYRFAMTVFADEDSAPTKFRATLEKLAGRPEVQQINSFAGTEYCARSGSQVECVGVEPQARLFLSSEGPAARGELDEELDVLLLLRTARKHWFRVNPDFVVTPT